MAQRNLDAEWLRERGLRATPARLAMLGRLRERAEPLSLADLRESLPGREAASTAYRMVRDFQRAGILRSVPSAKGLYELSDLPHHHHLICVRCGSLEDIVSCGVEAVAERAVKRSRRFAKSVGHALEVFAVCKSCK